MTQLPQYISSDSITKEFIARSIECFRANVPLEKDTILRLIHAARDSFRSQPTLIEIDPGEGKQSQSVETFTVILLPACFIIPNQTKGQLFELLEIFRLNGNPSEKNIYLFNGDFVDRGPCSIEVAFVLYAYKLLYPNKFFINRGNHETVHEHVGKEFETECLEKYDQEVFDAFSDSFQALPIATVIARRYFVVHGGLPVDTGFTLDDIRALPRIDDESDLRIQLLWNDPVMPDEKSKTPRGGGQLFDSTVTDAFLKKEGLSMLIRSHEFTRKMAEGHRTDGNCVTVFSAANYQGGLNNGAYVNITSNSYNILTFQSPSYPDWYNPYKYLL